MPLSDRFGRKRPLIAGLVVYIAASIACALATSISDVVLWRFVQAFGGSVVPTVVQAMVRDLYDRNQSARILSLNMLVTASAPVVAPLIGGQVLLVSRFRSAGDPLSTRFIADMQEHWEKNGMSALDEVRRKFPDRYVDNYVISHG